MKVGTKSVLFGAHAFWLHPWFVAAAWRRLYGFPWDPRLWAAFFVHDIGYWGKPNMDGPEGESHPEVGAILMHRLFDRCRLNDYAGCTYEWYDFTLYHSRFYAKRHAMPFSRLCVADKLSTCITPWWLYYPMARASGELSEYLKQVESGKYRTMGLRSRAGARAWYRDMQDYLRRWVEEHRSGKDDTWTLVEP